MEIFAPIYNILSRQLNIEKAVQTEHSEEGILMTSEAFEKAREDFNLEVYTEDSLKRFVVDLRSGTANKTIDNQSIEKAQKNVSGLVKIIETDKNGKRNTYWVKPSEAYHKHTTKQLHNTHRMLTNQGGKQKEKIEAISKELERRGEKMPSTPNAGQTENEENKNLNPSGDHKKPTKKKRDKKSKEIKKSEDAIEFLIN